MIRESKILSVALLAALLAGCTEVKMPDEEAKKYSVTIGTFDTFDEADRFKSRIDFDLWSQLRIVPAGDNKYLLQYGKFNSSFEAGAKGFELLQASLINNYKVSFDTVFVRDDFGNLLFISKYHGRPSIFNYDFVRKNSKFAWGRWGRKVIALNHSSKKKMAFFITALGYGKQGSFPYIRDARIYKFISADGQFEEIEELGSCIQLYTYWENPDTFKVNVTRPDSINSDLLIQTIISFDENGVKTDERKRKFSLSTMGFPKPPVVLPNLLSPAKKKQLRAEKNIFQTSVFIRDLDEQKEARLISFSGNLVQTAWSADEKFLFMVARLHGNNESHAIFVLNLDTKEQVKNFVTHSYPYHLVHGNFLFFEEKKNGNSVITIYNFAADEIYDTIDLPGGSAINHLSF